MVSLAQLWLVASRRVSVCTCPVRGLAKHVGATMWVMLEKQRAVFSFIPIPVPRKTNVRACTARDQNKLICVCFLGFFF